MKMIMRALSRRLAALTAAAALAAVAACGSASHPHTGGASTSAAATFPVTIKAANGTVRIIRQPRAIISLAPTATEMLYAIGAGSQVTAVDQDSNYPPQAPTTSLSGLTPNIEAIVARKPD